MGGSSWSWLTALFALLLCGTRATGDGSLEAERRHSHLHLSHVSISNLQATTLLGPILNHRFSIPMTAVRRGQAYVGNNHRLRRVVKDLMTGRKQVRIGVVGGSITWGQGASERGRTDWFSLVSHFIFEAFPKANVTMRNGAVPGTPASYMVMCLELSVDPQVDLVFSEYVLNDGFADKIEHSPKTRVYERLVRRVLGMKSRPAMVMVQVPYHGLATPQDPEHGSPFHRTQEDAYLSLAQYYDMQSVSMRSAVFHLATFGKEYKWEDLMTEDMFHPGDGGFRVMADLVIYMIQQTALDLLLRPFGQEDIDMIAPELPPPMMKGNIEPQSALCLHQDALVKVVVSHEGWEYVNEGTEEKPKKGFVSRTPGSVLKIKIDTRQGRKLVNRQVPVSLAHLKSYGDGNMGIATARCESGCYCIPKTFDSNYDIKESQLYLATIRPSASPECVITVTVDQESTSNGGHKVKISSVMISELTENEDEAYRMDQAGDGHWGMRQHSDPDVGQLVIQKQVGADEKVEAFIPTH